MRQLLVIEDGNEYERFARLFLDKTFHVEVAHSFDEALSKLKKYRVDALLIDMKFDRPEVAAALIGDVFSTAQRLFSGDQGLAMQYIQNNQGALILSELRAAGFQQPALFVQELGRRRLNNLCTLYGAVTAVPSFDAARIVEAFAELEGKG